MLDLDFYHGVGDGISSERFFALMQISIKSSENEIFIEILMNRFG